MCGSERDVGLARAIGFSDLATLPLELHTAHTVDLSSVSRGEPGRVCDTPLNTGRPGKLPVCPGWRHLRYKGLTGHQSSAGRGQSCAWCAQLCEKEPAMCVVVKSPGGSAFAPNTAGRCPPKPQQCRRRAPCMQACSCTAVAQCECVPHAVVPGRSNSPLLCCRVKCRHFVPSWGARQIMLIPYLLPSRCHPPEL